ncbi:MAG: hemerythrin domain-containing protein [Elusimicrobiota bacterium]
MIKKNRTTEVVMKDNTLPKSSGAGEKKLMKATEELLKDHKLIRKVMERFSLDNPRFPERLKTLQRVVLAHAWFEDEIFLPAVKINTLFEKRFTTQIAQEHQDLEYFLAQLLERSGTRSREMEFLMIQFKAVLEAHFQKEEVALFPLAEKTLDAEGLNRLAVEMDRRKTEVRLPL